MIYFDHSATTPIHPDVLKKMHEVNRDFFANPSSIYKTGRKSRLLVEKARTQVANAIGASSEQIYFSSGGTEANNHVLWQIIKQEKKHVIISEIEHPAVSKVLKEIEIYGIEVSTISVNDQGVVKIEELIDLIKDETTLVSVMMANNEIGAIQPIKKIKQILKKYEIPLHTDAVQALGKIKVDVKELDVDYLSLSAHKFYGPKGIGALYVKNKDDLGSLIIGGNQESGVRGGTENISGIIGMGLAAELVTKNQDKWIKNLKELELYFLEKVKQYLPHAIHHKTDNLPGLISISFPGKNSNILMAKLDRADIAVSNGPACSSGNIKPSSVLKAIGLSDDVNLSTLRISFGKNNTIEEVDYLIKTLKEIV